MYPQPPNPTLGPNPGAKAFTCRLEPTPNPDLVAETPPEHYKAPRYHPAVSWLAFTPTVFVLA